MGIPGLGFRAQSLPRVLGFRVKGCGSRVLGLECRVKGVASGTARGAELPIPVSPFWVLVFWGF